MDTTIKMPCDECEGTGWTCALCGRNGRQCACEAPEAMDCQGCQGSGLADEGDTFAALSAVCPE